MNFFDLRALWACDPRELLDPLRHELGVAKHVHICMVFVAGGCSQAMDGLLKPHQTLIDKGELLKLQQAKHWTAQKRRQP